MSSELIKQNYVLIFRPVDKKAKNFKKWQTSIQAGGAPDQYILDAGQKKFGATECKECGIVYQEGDAEDENQHLNYHNYVQKLKFSVRNFLFILQFLCRRFFTFYQYIQVIIILCHSGLEERARCFSRSSVKESYNKCRAQRQSSSLEESLGYLGNCQRRDGS